MKHQNNNQPITNKFLLILLTIDLVFIFLHFYNSVLIPDSEFSPLFSLVDDTSIAEKFQYLKWAFISILFLYMCFKRTALSFFAWALLFIYLLLDDSLTLHERIGAYVVQNQTWEAPFGLRMQDMGELFVSGVAGAFLFSLLAWAYIKGNLIFKKVSKDMLVLFAILAVFGVGFDMLDQMVDPGRYMSFVFEIVEDGGEMFVGSVMLWYTFIVAKLNQGGIVEYLRSFFQSFFQPIQA